MRSGARGLGQLPEHREHQRLAVEIVGLGLAHRAVDVRPRPRRRAPAAGLSCGPLRSRVAEPGIARHPRTPRASRPRVPAISSPSACSARGSSAGRRSSRPVTCWRSSSASPSSSISARPTEPSGGRRRSVARSSSAAALASPAPRTSGARHVARRRSGRKIRVRQRERMVGSTRPGAWLTSSSSARGGGSSSTLSSAFSPALFRSSSGSTIATRQPPSPAVEPKNGTRAADVLDAGHGEELAGLLVDDAPQHQKIAVRLAGDAPRHRMVGRHGKRRRVLHRGRGRIGIGQHEARHAIGQRRLADALLAADQPGVRNAAAAIGVKQASARPRHGRTARASARGRRIALSSASALVSRAPRSVMRSPLRPRIGSARSPGRAS